MKRLLNVYHKIFGTCSYGGDPRHMNSFRIFYDIHSITYNYFFIKTYVVDAH